MVTKQNFDVAIQSIYGDTKDLLKRILYEQSNGIHDDDEKLAFTFNAGIVFDKFYHELTKVISENSEKYGIE